MIDIDKIRMDGGTQSRAAINDQTVADYAEAMADPNTVFPPIIVYHDGKEYWLADGFHRVAAWKSIGRTEIPAEVRQGDRRKAILHSCGANSAHGLRRSNADKRRAVTTLLEDAEWSQWSNNRIAEECRVSPPTVAKLRDQSLTINFHSEPRTFTTKHGTVSTMDTSNIGRPKADPPADKQDNPVPAAVASQVNAVPAAGPSDPYGYTDLTPEGLLDEANGLRAEVEDLRKKTQAQEREIADLKAHIKDLSSDNKGKIISDMKRHLNAVKLKRDDAMTAAKRMEYRLKMAEEERDAALKSLENQEITL